MRKITYQSILLNEKEGDTLTQQLRSLVEASYKHRINKTQNFRLNVAGYVVYPLEDDEKALQPITIQVDQSSGKASDGPETHPDQTCLNKILMQLIKNNIFSQETREINGETLKLTDPREYADKFKKLIKGEICNDGKKYSILFFSERAPCKIHNPRYNGRSPVCDKYIKDVLGEDFLEYIYYLVPHRENAQEVISKQLEDVEKEKNKSAKDHDKSILINNHDYSSEEDYEKGISRSQEDALREAEERADNKTSQNSVNSNDEFSGSISQEEAMAALEREEEKKAQLSKGDSPHKRPKTSSDNSDEDSLSDPESNPGPSSLSQHKNLLFSFQSNSSPPGKPPQARPDAQIKKGPN